MSLEAVLFDMDGLLVDTEPLWFQTEVDVAKTLGGEWSHADHVALVGASQDIACRYIRARADSDVLESEIAEMLVESMVRLLGQREVVIQPGAAALLGEVAESGLPFALVSASVRSLVGPILDSLARQGLPSFPHTVAGDEVARGKPDPLPYLTAAATLGVDIARTVILEDSANGVRAARAAGATVVAIPHVVPIGPGHRLHVRPSLVEVDLAELRRLVGT